MPITSGEQRSCLRPQTHKRTQSLTASHLPGAFILTFFGILYKRKERDWVCYRCYFGDICVVLSRYVCVFFAWKVPRPGVGIRLRNWVVVKSKGMCVAQPLVMQAELVLVVNGFDIHALKSIIERASLNDPDRELLSNAVETLSFLTHEIEKKGATIARLRKMLFGPTSEKTKDVLSFLEDEASGEKSSNDSDENHTKSSDTSAPDAKEEKDKKKKKKKRKGHGRRGADDYVGAEQVEVDHELLQHKDHCPCCDKGKVYLQNDPTVLVRVKGVAPLTATVYKKQRLRCHLCSKVFTAQSPEGIGDKKYDETAVAMIGLLKYGCGLPFYRIEKLGTNLGIPMPSGTQWDLLNEASQVLEAVWAEMVRQAAQGQVIHIDDTRMKVLALNSQLQKMLEADKDARTGVFTSGVVSLVEGHQFVLFFTGNKHAGENLEAILSQRDTALAAPIQMSDALASNSCVAFETILAHCLVHARRNFVDVAVNFPQEASHVIEALKLVYKHDAECKEQKYTLEERLRYHQEKSRPVMDELKVWLDRQFDDRLVEPNSSLGGAIKYMQNHWNPLTLFLRVAGAPLDNNIVERALKRVILHRKNALFYKTENGARVGDMFMSLIHTAEVQNERPFEYLVALQRYHEWFQETPADWMPWNYRETLSRLDLPPP